MNDDSTRYPRTAGPESADANAANGAPRGAPGAQPNPDFDFSELHREDAASQAGQAEQPPHPDEGASAQTSASETASAEEVRALRQNLEAAYKRIDELARALQAGERDREDFKKRLTRERERMIDVEKGNVAQTLLETVDELDLSLIGADPAQPLARGVKMIRDGIVSRLAALGVERVDLVGKPFDPNLAEAVDMEITAVPEDDQKVVQEIRPAYRMKERVIRPGRVKVAKFVQPAQA